MYQIAQTTATLNPDSSINILRPLVTKTPVR